MIRMHHFELRMSKMFWRWPRLFPQFCLLWTLRLKNVRDESRTASGRLFHAGAWTSDGALITCHQMKSACMSADLISGRRSTRRGLQLCRPQKSRDAWFPPDQLRKIFAYLSCAAVTSRSMISVVPLICEASLFCLFLYLLITTSFTSVARHLQSLPSSISR